MTTGSAHGGRGRGKRGGFHAGVCALSGRERWWRVRCWKLVGTGAGSSSEVRSDSSGWEVFSVASEAGAADGWAVALRRMRVVTGSSEVEGGEAVRCGVDSSVWVALRDLILAASSETVGWSGAAGESAVAVVFVSSWGE